MDKQHYGRFGDSAVVKLVDVELIDYSIEISNDQIRVLDRRNDGSYYWARYVFAFRTSITVFEWDTFTDEEQMHIIEANLNE